MLVSSSASCSEPLVSGIDTAPSRAAVNSPHWASTSTRAAPWRSVATPAGPLTSRLGSASRAKCRASSSGLPLRSIRIQPLAVMLAKEPAVLKPEAIRKLVR